MNRFPLEPSYAKLILASNFYKCQDDMVTLVSILSTENIWIPVAARDETRFNKLEDIRKGFSVENSDHLTLVNVYQSWKDTRYSESFLRKNFLLFRAMKQARKIREQLLEISDRIHYKNVEKYFESALGLSDDGPTEKRFRRCMTEGFYMNAARHIKAQKEGTYLTAHDKIIVKVDRWSVFDMFSNYPDWLLYTELAGTMTGNKGIMRLATDIKVKWIEKKIPMLEKVDMERLEYAGDPPLHAGTKRTKIIMEKIETLIDQKKKENEAEEKNAVLSRDEKIRLAKERMLARKRQKSKE